MKLYLIHDGVYREDNTLAIFTSEQLAKDYCAKVRGVLEEWDSDPPPESWGGWTARLQADKQDGQWRIRTNFADERAHMICPQTDTEGEFGHYSGWGSPDPQTGEYTHAHFEAAAKTEMEALNAARVAFVKAGLELGITELAEL